MLKTRTISKIIALLLCFFFFTGTLPLRTFAAANEESIKKTTAHADVLVDLNLFKGTANGYELERSATRIEGLVMLLRFLGLEDEALAYDKPCPFKDLPAWSVPYASYAKDHGLTTGVTATSFNPNGSLDARSYVTFLLRGLGYSDSNGDFTWEKALEFAAKLSLISADSVSSMKDITLTRGDMVDISFAALTHTTKSSNQTLASKLCHEGVFSRQTGLDTSVLSLPTQTYQYPSATQSGSKDTNTQKSGDAIVHSAPTIATSSGNVNVNVLTVDISNPNVSIKAAMVDNTIGATASFSDIVEQSGADAVINGNFFESYQEFKTPIGHVMVDNELFFCCSGLSSLGITEDGKLYIGRPAIFTRLKSTFGSNSWSAYEINNPVMTTIGSTLYTSIYGSNVNITLDGHVMVIKNGVITDYRAVSAGSIVSIPDNGSVMFMGSGYTSTNYFHKPNVGTKITVEYYLCKEDKEGFRMDGLESMISGGPRLVQDSVISTEMEASFQCDTRFTTMSTCRTAIGIDSEGKLLLVNVKSATIQQMREIMLALDCVDAFNLDGGGSCAMYYDGKYISTPCRNLTTTLQVFVQDKREGMRARPLL